ncbi:hypothetical protein L210DRAFT_3647701 [Boletus edulis BED1]|uniref:Uncharacterized protein n=1 Tax=Boletus edulis BED1 TaxID=1328754 RepID=A0AAD4BPK8_BOLED|nr:hypothetical protein L210DRAFT_3647701 [Boletus edulis BED1]
MSFGTSLIPGTRMPPPPNAVINFTLPDEPSLEEMKAKFPHRVPKNRNWSGYDAKVITYSGEYAITSPNMDFVPSYIFEQAKLHTRKDGRWGYLDPFQTPQEWSQAFCWAPLIPRKDGIEFDRAEHATLFIWRTPDLEHTREENGLRRIASWFYSALEECAQIVAEAVKDFVKKRGRPCGVAETLLLAMRRNLINVRRPLSLRDICLVVANFQHCWLDLLAMLLYYQDYWDCVRNLQPGMGPWDVNTRLMGVFTNKDSMALNLWEAGVPVWHICKIDSLPSDLRINKRVTMTWDKDIETHLDDVQPLSPIHTGFETLDDWIKHAGPSNAKSATVAETFSPSAPSTSLAILAGPSNHHALPPPSATRQADLKTILPGLVDEISAHVISKVGKTLSPSAPPSWEDPVLSTTLTPVVDVWATALWKVDHGINTGGNILRHGFPFPDPLQILWVESGDWFASGCVGFPATKIWREILNGLLQFISETNQDEPTYAGYRQISWLLPPPWDTLLVITKQSEKNCGIRQAALDFLGSSKQQFQILQRQVPDEVHFHDRSWRIEEVHTMPSVEVQTIFWELTELLLRYELLLMDHVLCAQLRSNVAIQSECERLVALVFGTSSLDAVIHDALPDFGVGLTSSDPVRRWERLVHLVKLMSSWPGARELLLPSATDPGYLEAEQSSLPPVKRPAPLEEVSAPSTYLITDDMSRKYTQLKKQKSFVRPVFHLGGQSYGQLDSHFQSSITKESTSMVPSSDDPFVHIEDIASPMAPQKSIPHLFGLS